MSIPRGTRPIVAGGSPRGGDILRRVDDAIALARDLAAHRAISDIRAPAAQVRRHGLAPLAGAAGASGFREDLVRATVAWARIHAELRARGETCGLIRSRKPLVPATHELGAGRAD